MAVDVTLATITSGFDLSKINDNFTAIDTALQDAVSRSGTLPNTMSADLDFNSNDLLNVNSLSATRITINGQPVTVTNLATLSPDSVNTAAIQDGAVTSAKIANDTIVNDDLAEAHSQALSHTVTNRTALKGLDTDRYKVAYLQEQGREGVFKWDGSNLSAEVSSDTKEGVYIAPTSDATGASGAWVREAGTHIDVKWFGATGDGSTDDVTAINAAANFVEALGSGNKLIFSSGVYLVSSSVEFDGTYSIDFIGGTGKTYIKPQNSSLLEAVKFGANSIFEGRVEGLHVERSSYDGATDNIGVALYDISGATFTDCDSRFSKYPWMIKPGNSQRVAYSTFINLQGTGGLYNITTDLSGTGYANELVFLGGRLFDSSDTTTQVYINDNVNHWRFYAMSLEGTGDQAIYLNGTTSGGLHSVMFDQCRTEGTWSVDDVVLGANTLRCEVRGWNLYTTVSDSGTDNKLELASGSIKTTSASGAVTQQLINRSTADATVLDLGSSRDNNTSYAWRAKRNSDGLVRAYCTTRGDISGLTLEQTQGGWTFPLKMANYRLWVDSTGDLRIKNGAPTSDTDGVVVGTQT